VARLHWLYEGDTTVSDSNMQSIQKGRAQPAIDAGGGENKPPLGGGRVPPEEPGAGGVPPTIGGGGDFPAAGGGDAPGPDVGATAHT